MNGTSDEVHKFLREHAEGRVIETHAARIYLFETEVWKVKRAVKYDYLDFRELSERHRVLLRELELNKKTAPTLYEDVIPITKEDDDHSRVANRHNDASDADKTVVLQQTQVPKEALKWIVVSTEGTIEETLAQVEAKVSSH